MNFNQQTAALKALGRLEGIKNDLNLLSSRLGSLSLWLPATPLKKQCDEAIRMISDIAERFDRKLVATIVGPCGAGKSTLLNALAGVDDLSRVGHQRPTTGNVIIFSGQHQEAGPLIEKLGIESVEVKSSPAAALLEHVLLIDTPDTDSTAYRKHSPLVRNAIAQSDMLICVFDSENPKRRDHADFLAPFVQRFNGESLVGVINKCDRQDEQELKQHILPDFFEYLQTAWHGNIDRMLCVSARRHLLDPQWDESAGPKHDFDQFEDLQQLIFDSINRAEYVVDRRLENSRTLRNFVYQEVRQEISNHKPSLVKAVGQIQEAEKASLLNAVSAMKNDDSRQLFGVNLMVYQKLSQRWVGPMGWMIAVWARLLILGSGIAALFRFGRPVSQIMGMISTWRRFKDSKSAVDDVTRHERVNTGLRTYRLNTMRNWPDIAESLVNGGFEPSVRRFEDMLSAGDVFNAKLAATWSDALEQEIERISRKLSGFLLQILFNMPAFGILGYTGWLTLQRFFEGSYLSGNFFLHALWSIGIVMILSFFILQICIRLAGSAERITGKALDAIKDQIEELDAMPNTPVLEQLESVRDLEAIVTSASNAHH
ncbi:MAG: GTPase domain-containing protein [Desulfobacterales bacterium]|jgi:GTPase SAR1 family protein